MRYLLLFLLLSFSQLNANMPHKKTLRTLGTIERDVAQRLILESPVSGIVEKVFVDEKGKNVSNQEPLVELFSPELYGAEVAYICALQTQNVELIEPTLTRLVALGAPQEEIVRLTESCEAKRTFTLNAPKTLRLIQSDLQAGQVVQRGQPLLSLEDPTSMVVVAQVYEEDLSLLQVGKKVLVELPSFLEAKVEAMVAEISSTKDPKTRATQVRLAFNMPAGKLQSCSFCIARIEVDID